MGGFGRRIPEETAAAPVTERPGACLTGPAPFASGGLGRSNPCVMHLTLYATLATLVVVLDWHGAVDVGGASSGGGEVSPRRLEVSSTRPDEIDSQSSDASLQAAGPGVRRERTFASGAGGVRPRRPIFDELNEMEGLCLWRLFS